MWKGCCCKKCGEIIIGPLQGEWCNGPAPAKEPEYFLEEMLALVFCLCYSKLAVRRRFAFLSIQFSGVSPGFPYKKNYFCRTGRECDAYWTQNYKIPVDIWLEVYYDYK